MATAERAYYRLIFPEELEQKAVEAFVSLIGGLPHTPLIDIPGQRTAIVSEVWGDRAGIHHRVGFPVEHKHLINQLRTHTNGVHVEEDEGLPLANFTFANEYGLTSDLIPLHIKDHKVTAASILTSLYPLAANEVVAIQWIIAPSSRQPPKRKYLPRYSMGRMKMKSGNAFSFAAKGIFNVGSGIHDSLQESIHSRHADREEQKQALAYEKWQGQMFSAICRIGIRASSQNIKMLHDRVINTLQAISPYVYFQSKSYGTNRRIIEWLQLGTVPLLNWPCFLNTNELTALLAWPIDSPSIPGLQLGGSYQAPASPKIPVEGRRLGYSNYNGAARPLAIPWPETLRHFYTVGSTGSGKTTLLENCAIQDMKHGAGLIYIDPKGDSAQRLINCIPSGREHDVIYFDPTNKREVVGLNLFADSTKNPGLITDNIVGMFKKLYKTSWGARLENTLQHAVRTVAEVQYITLLEVSELLINDTFRHQLISHAKLSTPLLDFWKMYEDMPKTERSQVLAPIMNKLQAFSVRDEVRHIIGQSIGISMQEVIAGRKILICNLQKGQLGEENTQLLGSIIMLLLWLAVQRRPQYERKNPFYCYVDECQDFLNLPTPLRDILSQARGYGFGLTLANQLLEQLEKGELLQDVLANVNSFAFFKLPAHDANIIARQYPNLEPKDFNTLGQYQIITSISTGDYMRPKPTVGLTYPEIETTGSAQTVLDNTRNKYAYPCYRVDEDLLIRREAFTKRAPVGYRPIDK